MQTIVALSPQDAEAHNKLGVTLKELGRLDEGLASYITTPDSVESCFCQKSQQRLGNTLKKLKMIRRSSSQL